MMDVGCWVLGRKGVGEKGCWVMRDRVLGDECWVMRDRVLGVDGV